MMFDIQQSIYDEHGEYDEQRAHDYIDGMMQEFSDSPEAEPIIEATGDIGWAGMLMHYAIDYIGVTPAEMTLADVNEVLFELFPREVSTEPESAPEIIEELTAFWRFLDRQYELPHAGRILAALDDNAVNRLKQALSDPTNFGMAKSLFMFGSEAGFDMSSQEGLDEAMLAYNTLVARQSLSGPSVEGPLPQAKSLRPDKSRSQLRADRKRKKKAQRKAQKRNRK